MTCSHRRFGWVVVAAAGAVLMVVSCSAALRSCARGPCVIAVQADAVALPNRTAVIARCVAELRAFRTAHRGEGV